MPLGEAAAGGGERLVGPPPPPGGVQAALVSRRHPPLLTPSPPLPAPVQATPEEIKQQFRRLALRHHPDKAGNGGEEDVSRFTAIRDAFQVLKDPQARFAYDKTLLHQLDMQVRSGVAAAPLHGRMWGGLAFLGMPPCRRLGCSLSTSHCCPDTLP